MATVLCCCLKQCNSLSCVRSQEKAKRLDAFLTAALPQTTRSKVQACIEAGTVLVGGSPQRKPSFQASTAAHVLR